MKHLLLLVLTLLPPLLSAQGLPPASEGVQRHVDDAIFAEFDSDMHSSDAQSLPTSLAASKDLFGNIASYRFSEMRFNVRGYDSPYQDVYMNGILLNDALTGYTPWSLWSGLNDAVRNQEVTSNLVASDVGIGGIGGVTNIITSPAEMRKGLRVSLANGNAMYRFRGMVTYASGRRDDGWAYALSLSTRQGGNGYVDGVYYNAYGYFAALERHFAERHRLTLTLLGAPTERGAQQAATQEAFNLVGNNYYNPNWGWQSGKRRNARVRRYHEPLVMLNYRFDIDDSWSVDVATSLRVGRNGYSALTWQSGPDPRPDYYRYLPSYFASQGDMASAALQMAYWQADYRDIRHFDWQRMYETNRLQRDPRQESVYGAGARSNYMIEERHTDQRDWNFAASFHHTMRHGAQLRGGVAVRVNRTAYYSEVKDLLGGDYWVDIDKFAERDFASDVTAYQNDLDYFYKYGHARAATKGDRVGYNYLAHNVRTRGWVACEFRRDRLEATVGIEAGYAAMWREGVWRKGLFPTDSKGDSKLLEFLTYRAKGNISYRFSNRHAVEAAVVYMQNPPSFQDAFISPRTRNATTPALKAERVFGVDAAYDLRIGEIKFRAAAYYTYISNQANVLSYYDDVAATYTNFAMSGIDRKHYGVELAASVPVWRELKLNAAVSWGEYTYASNPRYVQMQDNSGEIISEGRVYWKHFRVESTPQTAVNLGLSYRTRNNIYLGVDFNYYDNMYLAMSPVYRTDDVITSGMTLDDMARLRRQEKFDAGCLFNASVGKTWRIDGRYTLGVNLEVRNLLNDRSIKSGGYEQTRLRRNTQTTVTSYEPFDAKYFYLYGTTYYMNLYFRF